MNQTKYAFFALLATVAFAHGQSTVNYRGGTRWFEEGRLRVDFRIDTSTRAVEEHDDSYDQSLGTDTEGDAVQLQLLPRIGYEVLSGTHVFAGIGLLSVETKSFGSDRYEYEHDLGPAWTVGLQQQLGNWREHALSFDFLFDFTAGSPGSWHTILQGQDIVFDADVEQWRIALRAFKRWEDADCFAGLQYSDLQITYEHPSIRVPDAKRMGGFDATSHYGVLIGAQYPLTETLSVEGTVHLIDSTGLDIQLIYLF